MSRQVWEEFLKKKKEGKQIFKNIKKKHTKFTMNRFDWNKDYPISSLR